MNSVRRSLLSALARPLVALALLVPFYAHAEQGVPQQVWAPSYKGATLRQRLKEGVLPTTQMQRQGKPPKTVIDTRGAETRLETELQTDVDIQDLPKLEAAINELVKSDAKAEALLGKGYKVVKLERKPRDMADPYFDTKDLRVAKSGGSLRIRIMNGVAVVNFKPPTADRFKNGVAHRVEAGIPVVLDAQGKLNEKTIAFLMNPRRMDNPLREWSKFYPDVDLRSVLKNQVVAIKQKRAAYEIHHNGVKVNELTVDHVSSTLTVKGQPAKQSEFGSFEGEGDHLNLVPTAQQLARMQAAQAAAGQQKQFYWRGAHHGIDSLNEALAGNPATRPQGEIGQDASPDVKQVHHVANSFLKLFGGKARPAGLNKYVRALIAHGMITQKEVLEGQAKYRAQLLAQLPKASAAPAKGAAQAAARPRESRQARTGRAR